MLYNYEFERRIRVGVVGAGEHAYRTILPCLQYLPMELVAIADENQDVGVAVARQFGARHFYPNHKAMLAKEQMDAVLLVLDLDEHGRPPYPALADEVMRAGFHVWLESPPCTSTDEVKEFTHASARKRRWVLTCFGKMFAPAYLKVASIIGSPEFGGVSSFSYRFPATLPPVEQRKNKLAMIPFLDFIDGYALLVRLFGECDGISYLRSNIGDLVLNIHYGSGVIGTMHLTGAQASTSPLERLEVVGLGANVVVENATRLTYYRAGGDRGLPDEGDRPTTFIGADETAPLIWEPEFTLAELYNKQLFLQGYVGSLQHFCDAIFADQPPRQGNVVDMLHIMMIHDKIRDGKERTWLSLYS
ncbi:MAG: Gfo/Idh/MocA family oxidoreductase, partial [Chloroflexi bacterium]|nr:Gfo/Idh/MocA family oxidoreductase [Chloroflexota bacterium]